MRPLIPVRLAVLTALLLWPALARAEGVKVTLELATYQFTSDGKPVTALPEKKELITSAAIPAQVDVPFEATRTEGETTITASGKVSADNRNPRRLNLKIDYRARSKGSDFELTSKVVVTLNVPKILGGAGSEKAGAECLATVVTVKSETP